MSLPATSKFRLSLDYYRQLHTDWLRHVSRWRRLTVPFAFTVILAGIAVYLTSSHSVVAFGLMATGIVQILHHLHHQRKWLHDRLAEKSYDHEVVIVFSEDKITISGPQGSGFCRWDAFSRSLITPKGLFLWPRKGVHIYIPDSSLTPQEAKAEIAARIGPRD